LQILALCIKIDDGHFIAANMKFDCTQVFVCEVCGSKNLHKVIDLGDHPMCDDLVPIGQNKKNIVYPISIVFCTQCNTAHQQYQIPKKTLFPTTYHYRSRLTADVLSGMNELVESVESKVGMLSGLTVLDIGCNDGSLLDKFAEKGANTIGVEPTGAHSDALGRQHYILNEFFGQATASKIKDLYPRVDIITFTNVFAHIENLPGLLTALSSLMHEHTVLVIENHYLGAVLKRNQFDTFYHEHPRTYSVKSFVHIAQSLGKNLAFIEFPKRYGGNVRVFIGNTQFSTQRSLETIQNAIKLESSFLNDFDIMKGFVDEWKVAKAKEIRSLVAQFGPLAAKAFPGRAAILLTLLGLSKNEIKCVYEKPGSPKIGHYVPATKIPILSDEDLFSRLDETNIIINLAWHIPTEIKDYLYANGYHGQIVEIV